MGKQEELELAGQLLRAAQSLVETEDLEEAIARFREVVDHCRAVGLVGVELQGHQGLARCLQRTGKLAESVREYEVVRSLGEVAGDKGSVYLAISNLGALYMHLGRWDDALAAARRTAEVAKAVGDKKAEVSSRGLAGQVLRRMGDLDGALGEALDGLSMAQELGDVGEELAFLGDMTVVAMRREEFEEATRIAVGALQKAEAVGNDDARAVFLGHLCQLARVNGDAAEARKYGETGLELAVAAGNAREQAAFLQDLAALDEAEGAPEAAVEHLRQSLDLIEELGHREGLVIGYRRLASLLCQAGHHERGLGAIAHAMALSAPLPPEALRETFTQLFAVVAQPWLAGADEELSAGLVHVAQAISWITAEGGGTDELEAIATAVDSLRAMAASAGDANSDAAGDARTLAERVDASLGTDLVGYLAEAFSNRRAE